MQRRQEEIELVEIKKKIPTPNLPPPPTYFTVKKKFDDLHLTRGINSTCCDVFEETVCRTVNYYFNAGRLISNTLSSIPTPIVDIILEYAHVADRKNQQPAPLKIMSRISRFEPLFKSQVLFSLSIEVSEANFIANYFNSIIPESVYVSKNPVFLFSLSPEPLTQITVKAKTLDHPLFFLEYSAMFSSLSVNEIERYQRDSKFIPKTTEECIASLNTAMTHLKSASIPKSVPKKIPSESKSEAKPIMLHYKREDDHKIEEMLRALELLIAWLTLHGILQSSHLNGIIENVYRCKRVSFWTCGSISEALKQVFKEIDETLTGIKRLIEVDKLYTHEQSERKSGEIHPHNTCA